MTPNLIPDPEGDALPTYAVRLSPIVTTIAVAEYDRLATTTGGTAADEWREGLLNAWASLATLPLRCPVAAENDAFQAFRPGPLLRMFLYRFSGRSHAWRILFTVYEETADDSPLVQVHQLRHSAQSPLTEWLAEDTE